jgi:hypothetical protein
MLLNRSNIKFNILFTQKFTGDEKMNKIILSLLCLLIISLGVSCASAADNPTMTPDSIQTHDSQIISVDEI